MYGSLFYYSFISRLVNFFFFFFEKLTEKNKREELEDEEEETIRKSILFDYTTMKIINLLCMLTFIIISFFFSLILI